MICDVSCVLPIGAGDWTAYLADRLTGAELPIERTVWRGTAGRAFTAVSEATIVLDPEYAARFGRRPVLWNNELRYRRDDGLMWTGPIVTVDDDSTDGVVWEARDRMELVMQRRWFWRSGAYAGDSANLMTIALRAADYGDPTGLIFDARPTGVITDMPVVAGDKVGPEINALGVPWTVVGDVVRYGRILIDTELELPADAFGDERPTIIADGYERLSHVAAVTDSGARVFYPSADPDDRPAGTPLLVDTIDVGDVTTGAARDLARQEWLRRQGELTIIADNERPLTGDFPLQWDDLVPGAVLLGSSQGRQLTAESVPVRLDGVNVELADGKELGATGSLTQATEIDLSDPYLHELSTVDGIVFPEAEIYPLDQIDGIDWSAIGLSPTGEFDVGIGSAPFTGIEPIDMSVIGSPLGIDGVDAPFVDPYADCPPSQCCDLCSGTGGGSGNRRIWLCTTLRYGATKWVSSDGDARTLHPIVAATAADSGFNTPAREGTNTYVMDRDVTSGQLPAGDVVTCDLDISAVWTHESGDWLEQGQFGWRSNPGQAMFVHPAGYFDTFASGPTPPPKPDTIAVGYVGSPPTQPYEWINLDPAAEGVTGFARGWLRIQYDPNTGQVDAWFGPNQFELTHKGSFTYATLPRQDYYNRLLSGQAAHAVPDYPPKGTRTVMHGARLHTSSLGVVWEFDQSDIDGLSFHYPHNAQYWQHHFLGNNARVGSNNISNPSDFNTAEFAAAPGGSPLWCFDADADTNPGTPPIWTDGDALGDPVIAVSHTIRAADIKLVEEQPSEFTGLPDPDGFDDRSCLVWAVADRSTFDESEINEHGWPDGYWPFGPRRS